VSRPAIRPTQPPIQWEPEFFPGGKTRLGRETDHSHLVLMSRSYKFPPPWRLIGVSGQRVEIPKSEDLEEIIYSTTPGSSGSIVSDYGLDDRAIEVRSPAEAKGFFLYPLCPDRL
jgi:hypothetical protein